MRELNKKIWPFKTRLPRKLDNDRFDDAYNWLKDNLNESTWYIVNGDTYYFTEEQDMLFFIMRWK